VVPDKIQTHPKGGYWKFQGRGDLKSHSFFVLGGGVQARKPSMGGYGYFLEQHIYLICFQTNGSPGLEKCPTPPPTAEKGRMLTVVLFISLLW